MLVNSIIVGLGGFLGSIFRYLIIIFFNKISIPMNFFPWATLTANLLGCFFIGLLSSYTNTLITEEQKAIFFRYQLFLGTGFLGSLTTFSTYNFEMVNLYQNHPSYISFAYFLISFLLGLLALIIGKSLLSA